jgi:hypothetical protein
MAAASARGGLKRGAAGVARELGVGSKALGTGDLGDQLGGGEPAAAGELEQRRGVRPGAVADLDLEGPLAPGDLADARQQLARDLDLDRLLAPGQAPGDS